MSQEPFGDIPLFREIQKLLASGGGPLNFEIARQVAIAVATQGATEVRPDEHLRRSFADAVHASEMLLSGYTRLSPPEPARSEVTTPGNWVRATLESWRWALEHTARRFGGELARLGGAPGGEADPMQAALGQIGPLLMGMQTGTLVGHLAKDALARYDLPIPREDEGKLFLVVPNVATVAGEYGLEIEGLTRWLALHEVARHLVMTSVPWVQRYFKSLLLEVVDAIEIDVSDLERRFVELQSMGVEALQEGVGADNVLPIVATERHRRALDRLRSFLALFEGFAMHAANAVASEIVESRAKIDEGMARRGASPSDGEAMLSSILGISVDRALETSGATFCAALVKLKGPAALNHVWEAPDNLPTSEEIKDPFAWMERQDV
ncbi:MAG: zinc-dependent metalloprotease [Actinomycetota bacterium]